MTDDSQTARSAARKRLLASIHDVRVAVHPGDPTKPGILASIERTLAAFSRKRGAGRYADLLAA